jgi:ABC-type amino acid transport substrate-binding protein
LAEDSRGQSLLRLRRRRQDRSRDPRGRRRLGVRKEDTDLRDLLNKGIAAIRANGKYKAINDKYFDFDAYGS